MIGNHDHMKLQNLKDLNVGVKVLKENNGIISTAHIANVWIVVCSEV